MSDIGGVLGIGQRVAELLLRPSPGLIIVILALVLTNKTGEVALTLCLWLTLR